MRNPDRRTVVLLALLFLASNGLAAATAIGASEPEATRAALADPERPVASGIQGESEPPRTLVDRLRPQLPAPFRERLLLLENWQWIALLLLAFIGVAIDRVVRVVVGAWLQRLLARSARLRERSVDTDFERPIGILTMGLLWWSVIPALGLPPNALAALQVAVQFVVAAAGVWGAYRLVDLLAAHFAAIAANTESKIDDIIVPLVRRALKIVVMAFGILFVAQNLDIDVSSLLAGLGLGGLAFALAAKDTVENLFGSVTVLVDRPFQIGDWIVVGEQEGTVEEIGFRSTRIRTFYNSMITVPNSRLVHQPVDNLGARRYRRVKCMISVQYDTPPDRIEAFCEGIRELIRLHPYTRKDYYMVYLNQFAGSSLDILLYAFHETPDWATELRERHRLFIDIVRLSHKLGVEFAFPTQTLHVASVPAGWPAPGSAVEVAPSAADGVPSPPSGQSLGLGRAEAQALAATRFEQGRQPGVDFSDPDRISPRDADDPAPRRGDR